MRFSKAIISYGAVALIACLGATQVEAQQAFGSVSGGAFDFTGSSFGASSTSTAFTFLETSTTGPLVFGGTTVSGLLTLSGTTTGAATSLGSPGQFVQELTGVSETITSGGHTVVSTSGATGYLIGLGNDKVLFSLGGTNVFSSDYFTLAGKQSEVLNFTTSSNATVTSGSLSAFSATLNGGTFRSSSVPEASTLLGLGGLVLGGGFFGLRRRKA